jgi:hypothetical protein
MRGGRLLAAGLVLHVVASSAEARPPRRLLERATAALDLQAVLVPAAAWHPFPRVGEGGWDAVSQEQRRAFVTAAERELATGWSTLPATAFLAYERTGDRGGYERLANQRRHKLGLLLLGELFEAKGRFVDATRTASG